MRFFLLLSLLFFFLIISPVSAIENYVIIVNSDNPISEISKKDLIDIFHVKKNKWKDGSEIRPVNLGADNPVRISLSSNVFKKSTNEMESYYLKQIAKSNFLLPKSLESEDEILKFVSSNKDSIGYVSRADSSVKVIPIKNFILQKNTKKQEITILDKKAPDIVSPLQPIALANETEVQDTITPFFEKGNYAIIVNPKNPVSKLNKEEFTDIFKGIKKTWPDDSQIMLVSLKKDSEMMKSYYRKKGIPDKSVLSISFDTEEDVIKSVSINKRSIGYVSYEDSSVKIITVDGLSYEKRVPSVAQITPVQQAKSEKVVVEDPVTPLFEKGKYLIIVNPKNQVSKLTKEELIDIYKSKKRNWPNGDKIMLVTLNQNADEIISYYKRNNLLDKTSIPFSFATEEDVIKFVSINKRSIGYVSHEDNSVKVIPVTDISYETKEISTPKTETAEAVKSIKGAVEDLATTLFSGKYYIIVNSKNSVSSISSEELTEIYKGQKKTWPDGSKIMAVYNKKDSEIIKSYYEKKGSSEASAMPLLLETDDDILKFVLANKRSIAYVTSANSSVKVISVGSSSALSKETPIPVVSEKIEAIEPIKPLPPPPPPVLAKKEPEKPEVIIPASLSSASNQTFKMYDSSNKEASLIVITNPSFSKNGKSPITASDDIKIHIPDSLNMEWDSSVSNLMITGEAVKHVKSKVTYSADNRVLIIYVIKDFPSNGSIRIKGMKFIKLNSPSEKPGYLWMEVNNKGIIEDEDDKSIEITSGKLALVITEPLKKNSSIGNFVSTIISPTKVAGKAFDLELYIVNEENKRVDVSGEVTLKDQWISPANPQVQKHISLHNRKVDVIQGYAKISMEYPEAGKIKVIAENDTTIAPSELEIIFKPAYLTINAPACGISGKSTQIIVTAVNATGSITANYEGSFSLDSKISVKQLSGKPSVVPASGTKIPITGGRAEVALLYEDSGSILLSATESEKNSIEQLMTIKPEMVCFRPASFLIKNEAPAAKKVFFYTSDSTCKNPEYVDLTISAVNDKGKNIENFEGTISFTEGVGSGVVLPAPQTFLPVDKGVKFIRDKFYSSVEQAVELKVTGVMANKGCTCSTITGTGKSIIFKQGNIAITSKTGAASGLTRQKAGNIVQISRTGASNQVEVPVSLKFNNGEIITVDSETKVFLQVESENGDVAKSVSMNGDGSFIVSKGTGSVIFSDSEGEIVKVKASSKPCLTPNKGTITFIDDKLVVQTTSGGFNEEVSIKFEIQDKMGKIINKYDGVTIDDIVLEPNKNYVVKGSSAVVIKNGIATVTVRNNNPKSEKSEIFLVKPVLNSTPLIIQPAKIRFTGKSAKSESSFDFFK